jgi:hypothetical protein
VIEIQCDHGQRQPGRFGAAHLLDHPVMERSRVRETGDGVTAGLAAR